MYIIYLEEACWGGICIGICYGIYIIRLELKI